VREHGSGHDVSVVRQIVAGVVPVPTADPPYSFSDTKPPYRFAVGIDRCQRQTSVTKQPILTNVYNDMRSWTRQAHLAEILGVDLSIKHWHATVAWRRHPRWVPTSDSRLLWNFMKKDMLSSIAQRGRNSFRGPVKQKIFFSHIPKCGGTSVRHALRSNYITLNPRKDDRFVTILRSPVDSVIAQLETETSNEFCVAHDSRLRFPEQLLLYYMNQRRTMCIVGHVPFSRIAHNNFSDEYAFITILRNPVERYISEFFYNKHHSLAVSNMELEEYLDSDYGRAQGTQYVLFVGGRSNGNDHLSKKAVDRALDNLTRYAVIGFIEESKDFSERCRERFGIELHLGTLNLTPESKARNLITNSIRTRIESICQRDLEIHHRARMLTA